MLFENRAAAGRSLAGKLKELAGCDCVVLALPRGGVPVGAEVAAALNAPLDVVVVRKLGAPGFPEFAIGAIASGGARVIHDETVRELGLSSAQLEKIERAQRAELERRETLYRGDRPPTRVEGKTVILVDDGLATGATMTAAARAIRRRQPERLVIAVPVGSADTCARIRGEADELICVETPSPFYSVGSWYADFSQTSDEEVRRLLDAARGAERLMSVPIGTIPHGFPGRADA